ncbi:FAD:protein FMN transferase [Massilia soli]
MRRVLVPLAVRGGEVPEGRIATISGTSMGTTWSAKAVLADGFDSVLSDQLQGALDDVVAQMSHWEAGSNLGVYNRSEAGSWHVLPEAFARVIDYALWVRSATSGAYDPCAGALVNLWGFGPHRRYDQPEFHLPSAAAIRTVLARGDGARVRFDPVTRRILQPGSVELDLSAVAKGFAVDQLARTLEAAGVNDYLVEAGGELRGAGVKPDGQPWWVELESVPGEDSGAPMVVALHGLSVATSGDYRRQFRHGDLRASHTLDPLTGYPIANRIASVSVLHRDCMAADALSTALSVLGPDAGLAFAERHQLAARFLLRAPGKLEEITSSALRAMLQ